LDRHSTARSHGQLSPVCPPAVDADWLVDRKRTVPDWFKRTQAIQARVSELRADLADHAELGAVAGGAGTDAYSTRRPLQRRQS